jgi:hypothetical protein
MQHNNSPLTPAAISQLGRWIAAALSTSLQRI